ncbi:MAG: helix-turn-helix domain-containing protein [Mailhella sp.]|nr:helix-turn-helix domain-containing protein [Mailhella sp.]
MTDSSSCIDKSEQIVHIFCSHVMRLLSERQLTQSDIAEACGLSPSIMTEIAKGTANPKLMTMAAIAQALNVPLALLFLPENAFEWEMYKAATALARSKPKVPKGYAHLEDVVLPEGKIEIIKEWTAASNRSRGKKM